MNVLFGAIAFFAALAGSHSLGLPPGAGSSLSQDEQMRIVAGRCRVPRASLMMAGVELYTWGLKRKQADCAFREFRRLTGAPRFGIVGNERFPK